MRRLPSRVVLQSHRVGIVKVPGLLHDGDAARGTFDGEPFLISIDPTLGPERMKNTLIHEVLHAAFEVSDVLGKATDMTEEALVHILTPILFDFIRSNKAAIAYIQEV